MRIVNVIQCTNLGGMEQASLRLMRALAERGHELSVVSLNPLGAMAPRLAAEGIPAQGIDYKGRGGWRSILQLRHALSRVPADALIMTGHNLMGMLALGSHCKGRRLLAMHFHHTGVKPDWQWRLIYRLAMQRFNAITYPSNFVRNEAIAILPGLKGIARTVRNPLEPAKHGESRDASGAALRQELGLAGSTPLVGNAGWLIERKRFDVFLNTAKRISELLPEAHFVIAGDGPERAKLERLAGRLGLADRIHWLGWRQDLQPFYCALDVLLFATDWDAFPTTPLEAMAHGVPVVASAPNSGLDEVIDNPSVGWLLREHDAEELARRCIAALTEEGTRMGIRGGRRVVEMSDPRRIALEVERLLEGAAP